MSILIKSGGVKAKPTGWAAGKTSTVERKGNLRKALKLALCSSSLVCVEWTENTLICFKDEIDDAVDKASMDEYVPSRSSVSSCTLAASRIGMR